MLLNSFSTFCVVPLLRRWQPVCVLRSITIMMMNRRKQHQKASSATGASMHHQLSCANLILFHLDGFVESLNTDRLLCNLQTVHANTNTHRHKYTQAHTHTNVMLCLFGPPSSKSWTNKISLKASSEQFHCT